MENKYDLLSLEEYFKHLEEEENIVLDIDFITDNIAEEIHKEKEINKYIRSFNTHK